MRNPKTGRFEAESKKITKLDWETDSDPVAVCHAINQLIDAVESLEKRVDENKHMVYHEIDQYTVARINDLEKRVKNLEHPTQYTVYGGTNYNIPQKIEDVDGKLYDLLSKYYDDDIYMPADAIKDIKKLFHYRE